MESAATDSIDDELGALRARLVELEAAVSTRDATIVALERRLDVLLEALRIERARAFGARSEKSPDQSELFDEVDGADAAAEGDDENGAGDTAPDEEAAPRSPRKRPVRKPLPPELPRVREVQELPEAERRCACGCMLEQIGEITSEQLDIVPARIQVIERVRKTYACRGCDEGIRTAAPAPVLLPKSLASDNTAAYAITAKYADGLPIYRLATILERHGVALPRQTLNATVLRAAAAIEPLIGVLNESLVRSQVLHIDETRVQVLKEPGRAAKSQSFTWVRRGGSPDKPIVLFHYDPGRSAAVAAELLSGFEGALMSDGYEPYRRVARTGAFVHLCCWAHARRKFVEAKKAQPTGRSGKADAALALIGKLYGVERAAKGLDAHARYELRQARSVAVLAELRAWLERTAGQVPPKGALGRAVAYALEYWTELIRHVEHGGWPIDNNAAENAIRPFVIGRKAWMFSDSVRGATASANLYSLVETAKANGREPYGYLCWLFARLPRTAPADLAKLAPWEMPA